MGPSKVALIYHFDENISQRTFLDFSGIGECHLTNYKWVPDLGNEYQVIRDNNANGYWREELCSFFCETHIACTHWKRMHGACKLYHQKHYKWLPPAKTKKPGGERLLHSKDEKNDFKLAMKKDLLTNAVITIFR